MDVAALGFAVDSSSLKEANDQMAKMPAAASGVSQAAKETEASYKRVQTAASTTTNAMKGQYGAVRTQEVGWKKVQTASSNAAQSMQADASKMTGALAQVTAAAKVANDVIEVGARRKGQYGMARAATVGWAAETLAIKTVTAELEANDAAVVRSASLATKMAAASQAVAAATNIKAAANENESAAVAKGTEANVKHTASLVTQAGQVDHAAKTFGLLNGAVNLVTNGYRTLIATAIQLTGATLGVITLYKFIEASVEAEQIEAQLGATLVATKEAAGQSAEAIKAHAAELQKLTTYEDDAIVASSALLLSFTRIKGDVFPKATEAVLDLATAMKMDLKSATTAVGKALNDPVKGMMTLQRMGVTLSGSQKELIKSHMAAGRAAEAQGIVLDALSKRFGGSAKAARDTLGGALTALGHAFGNLFEIGGEPLEAFKNAVKGLTEAIQSEAFSGFVAVIGKALFGALTLAVQGVTLLIDGVGVLSDNLDTLGVIAGTALIMLAPNILAGIVAGLTAIGVAGVKAVMAITVAMRANPFILLATAIIAAVTLVYQFRDAIKEAIGVDVVAVVKSAGNIVIQTFMLVFEDVKFIWNNLGDIVEAAMIGAVNAVAVAMNAMITFIAEKIDWLSKQINKVNPFKNIPMIGPVSPIGKMDNPAADRLKGATAQFGARREEIKSTDYIGKLGDAFTASTPKAKEFAGALGLINNEIDDSEKSKGKDPYAEIIKGAEAFIAKQKAEGESVGMAQEEALKFKYTTELLAKAKEADIHLTDQQIERLKQLGAQMAATEAQTTGLKQVHEAIQGGQEFIKQQTDLQATLGLSAEAASRLKFEQDLLSKATKNGAVISDEQRAALSQTAAEMAATEARTKSLQESFEFAQETTKSLFKSMFDALLKGKSIWEVFGNTVERVLDKVLDKLSGLATDTIFDFLGMGGSNGASTSNGGGLLGNLFNSVFGSSKNATGSAGGGGIGSLFSGIGDKLSGMWNQSSNWFSGLFGGSGGWGGISNLPAGVMGPAPNTAVGGIGGGIGAMGYLGAGLGGISGIMQLMKGGTGNTIGGIGSIIGAGVSLIPGIGQIAGPIISILSSVLPSLFGEGEKRTHSYTNANLTYGPGGYYTTGSAQGEGANSSQAEGALSNLAQSIEGVFDLFGGVKDPSKVWGLNLNSWTAQGKNWSYTSNATSLIGPNGMQEAWRMNMDDMMDTGSAQVVIRTVLEGALGEITDAMKTAMETLKGQAKGLQEVAESVTFVMDIYDNLGKPVLTTKQALKELDAQFRAISDQAKELGLSLDPVDDALEEARNKVAKDFMNPINMVLNPVATSFAALNEELVQMRAEAQHLIDEGFGSIVDMAKLEEYYRRKEQALAETLYGLTIADLQENIDSLTVGALSNATTATQFTSAKAAFEQTVQKALAGDTDASARLIEEGNSLAVLAKAMFGSTGDYENIADQITSAYELMQDLIRGTAAGTDTPTTSTPTTGQVSEELRIAYQQINKQTEIIANQTTQINRLLTSLSRLGDLLQRQVTNNTNKRS